MDFRAKNCRIEKENFQRVAFYWKRLVLKWRVSTILELGYMTFWHVKKLFCLNIQNDQSFCKKRFYAYDLQKPSTCNFLKICCFLLKTVGSKITRTINFWNVLTEPTKKLVLFGNCKWPSVFLEKFFLCPPHRKTT